jgi:preprotein translocase subunit SecD
MEQLTSANKGRPMAIALEGELHSAPIIQATISRNGIITGGSGGFSQEEVSRIVRLLNGTPRQPRVEADE